MGEVLLLIDGTDEEAEWTERALCAETDPEAFFPEKGGSTREAKKVCLSCDVRNECLDYALAHKFRQGDNPARWRDHIENLLPARAKVREVSHYAALPYAELPAFMVALREEESGRALASRVLAPVVHERAPVEHEQPVVVAR